MPRWHKIRKKKTYQFSLPLKEPTKSQTKPIQFSFGDATLKKNGFQVLSKLTAGTKATAPPGKKVQNLLSQNGTLEVAPQSNALKLKPKYKVKDILMKMISRSAL